MLIGRIIGGIALLFLVSCTSSNNEKLSIATSANMQFAMEALVDEFSEQTGIECQLMLSSSGKLTAQIQEGAPYDVFVSADLKYPTTLFEKNLCTSNPRVYAYGKLVLWTMHPTLDPSLAMITHPSLRHLAIANPKTAPYGRAAMEVIENMKIQHEIMPKLVYGESIAQVNQFVYSKSAEIGFTAMAVVKSPKMQEQGRWLEVDPSLYTPIEQGVVVLRTSTHLPQAQQFADFLFSTEAQSILTKFGYLVPSDN